VFTANAQDKLPKQGPGLPSRRAPKMSLYGTDYPLAIETSRRGRYITCSNFLAATHRRWQDWMTTTADFMARNVRRSFAILQCACNRTVGSDSNGGWDWQCRVL